MLLFAGDVPEEGDEDGPSAHLRGGDLSLRGKRRSIRAHHAEFMNTAIGKGLPSGFLIFLQALLDRLAFRRGKEQFDYEFPKSLPFVVTKDLFGPGVEVDHPTHAVGDHDSTKRPIQGRPQLSLFFFGRDRSAAHRLGPLLQEENRQGHGQRTEHDDDHHHFQKRYDPLPLKSLLLGLLPYRPERDASAEMRLFE